MEKKIETGWLLDFYGPLLTKRQHELLSLYCEEDLSLGEIAEQEQISRQGVHDAVQRAQHQLHQYEAQLGLLTRFQKLTQAVAACQGQLAALPQNIRVLPCIEQVQAALENILREEEGYDGL